MDGLLFRGHMSSRSAFGVRGCTISVFRIGIQEEHTFQTLYVSSRCSFFIAHTPRDILTWTGLFRSILIRRGVFLAKPSFLVRDSGVFLVKTRATKASSFGWMKTEVNCLNGAGFASLGYLQEFLLRIFELQHIREFWSF
jgi:hypothetical protein